MEEMRMKKTLAVLATVGALAATSVAAPAPAQARGMDLDWRSASRRARLLRAPPAPMGPTTVTVPAITDITVRVTTGRPTMAGLMPITADLTTGTATGGTGKGSTKSPEHRSGLFPCSAQEVDVRTRTADVRRRDGHFPRGAHSPACATKYSSRSRLNFSWVALKRAMRAVISSRSEAALSCSVMPSLLIFASCAFGSAIGA